MTPWVAGLALGLAGSGHCAVMCGPLVVAIDRRLQPPSRRRQLAHALSYHAGRVLTYVLLAIPGGLLGETIALNGFARTMSVMTGALLMVWLVLGRSTGGGMVRRTTGRVAGRICGAASRWHRTHPVAGPMAAGAANGLLPCGLVYAAVMTAAAMGSATGAVAVMVGFGCGTVPMLLGLTVSAGSLPHALRARLRQLAPVAMAIIAALLIARGLVPRHGGAAAHGHGTHAATSVR